jgi:hypothetical protein
MTFREQRRAIRSPVVLLSRSCTTRFRQKRRDHNPASRIRRRSARKYTCGILLVKFLASPPPFLPPFLFISSCSAILSSISPLQQRGELIAALTLACTCVLTHRNHAHKLQSRHSTRQTQRARPPGRSLLQRQQHHRRAAQDDAGIAENETAAAAAAAAVYAAACAGHHRPQAPILGMSGGHCSQKDTACNDPEDARALHIIDVSTTLAFPH